ncbi:syncoilin [Fundulus heteroclitus]|uniref:syncoilin n=1 Tax=Fundulus heteroclitus TaxID=8078 RepID=UPI00165BBA0D|nr:syncoilin [Fundulus heteroclitus]
MFNEETESMEDIAGICMDDNSLAAEERHESKPDLESDMNKLRSQMDDCIEEVQRLEKKRKDLLTEVLMLRGPGDKEEVAAGSKDEEETEESIGSKAVELIMILKKEEEGRREERKKEIHSLREERAEEERKTWKVNLERQGLLDELRSLRSRLFAAARTCAHSQAALNNQRCDVKLLRAEEEKLNSVVSQLTEESRQLRAAQQEQLQELQAQLDRQRSGQTRKAQEELTECRRNSCGDVQQYVQGGLKALEDRYEPILVALLKRKEATAGALAAAKEQSQELRVRLKPLREEIQKLELERTCLKEKLKLIHMQREEDTGHYKEAVHFLEENIRELRTVVEIQKRKNKDMEELRESLTKQLLLYRMASEDNTSCDQQGTT